MILARPHQHLDAGLRPALTLRLLTPQHGLPGAARLTAHGALISFIGAELTIGSHPASDLRLTGPGVAAEHCRIRERRGARFLLDHGSRSGTAVNGRTITEPTALAEGDRISVGAHVLEVIAPRHVVDPEHVALRLRRGARAPLPRPHAPAPPRARPRRARVGLAALVTGLLVGLAAPASAGPDLTPEPLADPTASPFLPAAPLPLASPFLPTTPASPSPALATDPPRSPFLPLHAGLWRSPRSADPPATALLPTDARSLGSPARAGGLRDALRLPPHPDYDLRCPAHAHASSATAAALLAGLARLRERYRGQIVVGDLSRAHGGAYGPHLSHQSGRDVDLWLPIEGGLYRAAATCRRCGTPWCRPAPDEVDWRATWALIDALASTGAVQQIFLDRRLHPRLRSAARDAGASDDDLAQLVQRRPGAPALVTHAAGHTRHIHVRFRCGPDEPSCSP